MSSSEGWEGIGGEGRGWGGEGRGNEGYCREGEWRGGDDGKGKYIEGQGGEVDRTERIEGGA